MKPEDILELIRAGYTKAEIAELGINMQKPDEQKPDDKIKALETKIDYLVNRLNYIAVQGSKQPDEHKETVEDILSSMVRGNNKKE